MKRWEKVKEHYSRLKEGYPKELFNDLERMMIEKPKAFEHRLKILERNPGENNELGTFTQYSKIDYDLEESDWKVLIKTHKYSDKTLIIEIFFRRRENIIKVYNYDIDVSCLLNVYRRDVIRSKYYESKKTDWKVEDSKELLEKIKK